MTWYDDLRVDSADYVEFCDNSKDASKYLKEQKALGNKARIYRWNNGSRKQPFYEYKVHVWWRANYENK